MLTTQQCQQYYPGQINERMLCTYAPGIDTCQGDSGGSIDLGRGGRYYHIGVVSWGIGKIINQRNDQLPVSMQRFTATLKINYFRLRSK